MSSLFELRQKGLIEAFNLAPHEVEQAEENLLGFFGTLQKIEQRLIREGNPPIDQQAYD